MKLNRRHLFLAGAVLAAWPHRAGARAGLVRSEPASESILTVPPARIVLVFSEPVEPGSGTIRVTDTIGRRVELGRASVADGRPDTLAVALDPLPTGTYDVAWRIAAASDGTAVEGQFVFTVTG
ncbi:copper resistance CopC family protein [Marinivivus vitaminiproducens]|uniref:copper resistance CopC family protein n=1 Tax=Marinivivus vitaminiproducens TaxID=3035935 RepID=UPI0027A67FA4|nr:copper resistance protein CopC [Geminicoccaceae bacterium SCSIO 64248]